MLLVWPISPCVLSIFSFFSPADLFMGVEEDAYCDCAKDKIITALAMC